MNIEHLRAFIWLRWRLFRNQLTRGGTANIIVFGLLGVAPTAADRHAQRFELFPVLPSRQLLRRLELVVGVSIFAAVLLLLLGLQHFVLAVGEVVRHPLLDPVGSRLE